MRVVGIDPGLNKTGYGFVDAGPNRCFRLLETGTIEPKAKDLLQNRLSKIHDILSELIVEYKPDVLILEKLYTHNVHPATGIILGHVRGVICLLCARKNIQLIEHSVKRIRKALLGNGNATKQQTKKVVARLLGVDEKKLTLDASDALALALGYAYMNG